MTARRLIATALIAAALGLAGAVGAAPERPGGQPEGGQPEAGQSRDGQNRRVRIHNQTGATLQRLQAADVRSGDFGGDLLGGASVATGSSAQVVIDDGAGGCLYDLRAELAGGQALLRENVNVCRLADYYLTR